LHFHSYPTRTEHNYNKPYPRSFEFSVGIFCFFVSVSVLRTIQAEVHDKGLNPSSGSVIAQLDWAIQKKELDYPVRRDNDNNWNRLLHLL
jgi:hypothetical protein